MGMYPGATISYGIEIPEDLSFEDLAWVQEGTDSAGYYDFDELAEARLAACGVTGVGFTGYGHMGWGETGRVLMTRSRRYYAYDVDVVQFSPVDAGDDARLVAAYEALFGVRPDVNPAWLLTLSYG